jgi:hypothetical protein
VAAFSRLPGWVALVLTMSAMAGGCASTPPPPVSRDVHRIGDEGYGILYKLMSDESPVAGIFILKSADPLVVALVKDIAKTCQDAKTQLDEFAKSDSELHFDVTDLPAAEVASRQAEADLDKKDLLGSSGKTFEVRLLFTQAQAMGYAANLSKAVAAREDDPARKDFLNGLGDTCAGYRDRAMELLTVQGIN